MVALVLLGAGASYGSVDAKPYPPPLGTQLFGALERRGGIAATLSPDLKVIFHADFEKGMAEYYRRERTNVMAFQRELGLYLAEFEPGPRNLYAKMLSVLPNSRVIYSSLNYDLPLEVASRDKGKDCIYGTEAPNGETRLLKIHGSCNFFPDTGGVRISNLTSFRAVKAVVDFPIVPVTRSEAIRCCSDLSDLAPAMSIYAEGKPVQVCPTDIEEQLTSWQEIAATASVVFVSGVKVIPADKHIWETLAQSAATLYYFGHSRSDEATFDDWRRLTKRANCHCVLADFDGAINFMWRHLTKV